MKQVRHEILHAPAYTIAEAARYLRMPPSTLRTWVRGATKAPPLIELDDPRRQYLSFVNLVESHVLASIRRRHQIQLSKVRTALSYVQRAFKIDRPLARQEFQTDGLDLFVQKYGQLISASRSGQIAMREVLSAYLKRVERDASGLPIRLYPFTRTPDSPDAPLDNPTLIVFAPQLSFGRPVIDGTGIPVEELVNRFQAGDSPQEIATDFDLDLLAVEEAIRYQPVAA